ncbi:transmembrane 9 superfamily member 4 [Tripterygium wilfordii]|uniref:Transmembrane 9 superfamily member n=1 Tax=Tripterygium wilfordii TaxID=458696 RepID=A0A7J7DNS1_TRIWF|nr:transmembrane 9 superfamily member 4 [Tripterygium wilfordii]
MEKRRIMACIVAAVLILCGVSQVRSDGSDHRFKRGEDVPLYANKVGPFHNPSETYRYFDLPFCSSAPVKEKKEALGEVLNGDRLVSAPYKLDFLNEKESELACKRRLTKEQVAQFRGAVSKDYYFQMYYDDLPIWGFLGKVDKEGKSDPSEYKYYLFKHLIFNILYNKDRVIEITVQSDQNSLVDITEDKEVEVEFTYTVKWKDTEIPFEKRMDKYSQSSSLPHHLEIHWFSIINSCVTVLLLTGFLATILMRVLKNDFSKYAHDEESADDQEETGWKYIHGDVFRYPKYKSLLAAALGSGHSCVEDPLACSFMATACITTMHDLTCRASCKPHFSLDTWLASAMVSFSCSGLSVSVLLYSSSVISTALSSASRNSPGPPYVPCLTDDTGEEKRGCLCPCFWTCPRF